MRPETPLFPVFSLIQLCFFAGIPFPGVIPRGPTAVEELNAVSCRADRRSSAAGAGAGPHLEWHAWWRRDPALREQEVDPCVP